MSRAVRLIAVMMLFVGLAFAAGWVWGFRSTHYISYVSSNRWISVCFSGNTVKFYASRATIPQNWKQRGLVHTTEFGTRDWTLYNGWQWGGFGWEWERLLYLAARRQRNTHGTNHLCPICGYDLRATPDRCPECGYSCSPSAEESPPENGTATNFLLKNPRRSKAEPMGDSSSGMISGS